jgi:hypothetical protein
MEQGPVDVLRDGARRAVETTNLRVVAGDLGMSARGLLKFLDGRPPRARTLVKLRDWYVRRASGTAEVTHEAALAALAVLLDGVPPRNMRRGATAVLESVRLNYREAGVEPPEAIAKLLE